ncbi:hypothetical protein MRX96_049504 [Rhipicephalus microplus]
MTFHKMFRYQHHTKNKKSGLRNAKCMAKVDEKIKLVTFNTKRRDKSTGQTFLRYLSEGMTSSEARRLHESKLSMEDEGPAKLANAALNPPQRTVYHWHSVWREACFGGTHIDPVLKLEEKASLYAAQGTHTSVTHGDSSACWAVFVVTPIMRRAHNLELAREIVFVDSTASCDTTKCTQTWPSARQLLCHFHVAQAEWRWLTTSHNSVDKDQRRRFMSAFQLVMYADTAEKLEAATAELKALQHEAFVSRVLTFLRRQEEWVQLDRLDVLTRGHNTNNFAEATIRVLKGIILNRVEAFNAAALVDSVALVWEKYFESRILRHAYNRVAAHQLLYKRLLSRMPKDPAEAIQVVGQGQYIVPSATHPSSSYEVYADIGLCTCLFGKQGAFCKHQALVQKKFGGLFANAPALSTDDRYQLGQLALGEKCPPPPPGYFSNPSKRRSPAVVPEPRKVPVPSRRSQTNSNQCKAPARKRPHTLHLYHQCLMQPNLPSIFLSPLLVQAQEHAYEFLEVQLQRVHSMNAHNPAYLDIVKGLGEKLARVQNSSDGTGLMLALKATAAARRCRARHIRVQPTSTARRRPGLTRGSKSVPTGRPAVDPAAKRAKKRPHFLSHNIEKNVPGARLH